MPASPYADLERPPLVARSLERGLLTPGGFWRRLDLRDETDSTNADVAAAARAGEPEGLIVVAEQQLAGRGRRGRDWVSPPRAGLTVSVLLRPGASVPARGWSPVPPRAYGWLTLLAAEALRATVEKLAGLDAVVKWPNDLLVRTSAGEAKCAGILAEIVDDAVVLGIGLNVTTRPGELPDTPTGLPATSLQAAGAEMTDRDPLLRSLLRGLAQWYEGWRDTDGDAEMCGLLAAYRNGCATVGRPVRVLLPAGDEIAGQVVTVDPDGQLVIRTADAERRVSAGDVVHVR
ncbi:biotin--[acetyl-CoA-carboxylase] ligase [Krasilnikovia sp. MM14-A1259]|uniref:biotin--[acetyl-CoA-carboxylase] ligase n=1 Tax=Krasilnikovia sp. MM14-A1259 TaxID=3373539 RepID=UPI00382F3812